MCHSGKKNHEHSAISSGGTRENPHTHRCSGGKKRHLVPFCTPPSVVTRARARASAANDGVQGMRRCDILHNGGRHEAPETRAHLAVRSLL